MKLVINTNTNTCRIYHYIKHPAELSLLKEIHHPENRLKSSDIISDRPGSYKTGPNPRSAFSPHIEAKELEYDKFSREIAKELDQARTKNGYDELIIIAPPHMNGLLFQHINKQVKELVIKKISKDMLHLKEHELLAFLKEHTQFAD